MGCDGGTIPKRDELVRKKKRPEQKDKTSELSFRWQHCNITQLPLQNPIVACGLGKLYNKDAVIEMLLDKSIVTESVSHIKSMKDVKELNLTPNPTYKAAAEKGDGYSDHQSTPYICPVIGIEMNGNFRFVCLWSCGCTMSERSLKQIKTKVCHKCQKPFEDDDVVILNGTDEDVALMKERMLNRQAKIKAEKKAKQEAKQKIKLEPGTPQENGTSTVTNGNKTTAGTSSSSSNFQIPNGKISGTLKIHNLKRPNGEIVDPVFKKTKSSYSVAQDPKASEVYKSLFTSHRKATEQTKAHWITYNPFYN